MTYDNHDRLHMDCFMWLWNNFPELRMTHWGIFNDIKIPEKIIGAMLKVRLTSRVRAAVLSMMKSLGMVKGVLDFMFYHNGVLHVMDFKVKNDRLKPEQLKFIAQIEAQGGKGYEIRSLEQFQGIINNILKK